MKSLFHFDLDTNYMTETNHIIWTINRRPKTCQCHNCHHYQNIPAIQETYIQYMQNYWLLEAFCMCHHCQLWLTCPFRHQLDSHLSDDDGAAWENVLHENLTGKKQKAERERGKGSHIHFLNFSSHATQGWTPLPISSKSSLPQPHFSCISQFSIPVPLGSSNLFPQASLNNTLIGNSPKHPILPLNSLQSHLPPTFISPNSCAPALQSSVWHICSHTTDHTANKALCLLWRV